MENQDKVMSKITWGESLMHAKFLPLNLLEIISIHEQDLLDIYLDNKLTIDSWISLF